MWQKDRQREIVRNIKKAEVLQQVHIKKVCIETFIPKSLYQKVYIEKFTLKRLRQSLEIFIRMKHYLYIHQDYQPSKTFYIPID